MSSYLINGEFTDKLSVEDRSLHYGDGVFETLVAIEGKPQDWAAHIERLQKGCQRLNISPIDETLLEKEVQQLLSQQEKARVSRCVIKIIITRGIGQRGYKPPADSLMTRIIAVYPYPEYPERYFREGVKITVCKIPLSCNPVLAGIKHLNRLEQVMAQDEWKDPAIVDGIMLNNEHHVIECTMSNLFWVMSGQLFTPDLSNCGVEGVTRANILKLAKELQIPTTIDYFDMKDLLKADEILITNSVFGILPVRAIDAYTKPVGPVTQKLMSKFT